MMSDYDEQESQLPDFDDRQDGYDVEPWSDGGHDDDLGLEANNDNLNHLGSDSQVEESPRKEGMHDSVGSPVEETQFEGIEPDTQAQAHSMHKSVVQETQYVDLEPDTQAPKDVAAACLRVVTTIRKSQSGSPGTDKLIQQAEATTTNRRASPLEETFVRAISRPKLPDTEEHQQEFRFGKANIPKPSSYSRPRLNPNRPSGDQTWSGRSKSMPFQPPRREPEPDPLPPRPMPTGPHQEASRPMPRPQRVQSSGSNKHHQVPAPVSDETPVRESRNKDQTPYMISKSKQTEPLQREVEPQKEALSTDHQQEASKPLPGPQPRQPPHPPQSNGSNYCQHSNAPSFSNTPVQEPPAQELPLEPNTPRPQLRHIPATESNGTPAKRVSSRGRMQLKKPVVQPIPETVKTPARWPSFPNTAQPAPEPTVSSNIHGTKSTKPKNRPFPEVAEVQSITGRGRSGTSTSGQGSINRNPRAAYTVDDDGHTPYPPPPDDVSPKYPESQAHRAEQVNGPVHNSSYASENVETLEDTKMPPPRGTPKQASRCRTSASTTHRSRSSLVRSTQEERRSNHDPPVVSNPQARTELPVQVIIETDGAMRDDSHNAAVRAQAVEEFSPERLQSIAASDYAQVAPFEPHSDISENNLPPQIPSRGQSRAESDAQSRPSRPHSRRSNHGKYMRRPLGADELHSQGISDHTLAHSNRVSKEGKSRGCHTQPSVRRNSNTAATASFHSASAPASRSIDKESPADSASGSQQTSNPQLLSKYKDFLRTGETFEQVLIDYELQKQRVVSQQAKIEQLRGSDTKSQQKVEQLESEKQELTRKIIKFTELSFKYTNHINDVVKSQKYLKSQAAIIRRNEAEVQNIGVAIRTIDNNRAERILILTKMNQNLKADLESATKSNSLLQADLNKHLLELGQEKHISKKLQSQLQGKVAAYEEIAKLLKQIPSGVVDELAKEQGTLAKVLSLVNATQAKVDEAATVVTSLKNQQSEQPAALAKLMEDFYTRIEKKLQALANDGAQESAVKLFEGLKGHVNQIRLDHEVQTRLNDRIAELREVNATLTADKNAQGSEVQSVTKQAEELRRDLADSRGQLSAKSDELAAILALPKEDPKLQAKIRDLENTNSALQGQLDAVNEETSRLKSELTPLQEASLGRQEEIKEIERKFKEAQTRIKSFNEEKKKYQEACKTDSERTCQELAKKANNSKTEMNLKHQAIAKNLEKKRAEAEAELDTAKEELQRIKDERVSSAGEISKLRTQLATVGQLDARMQHLAELNTGLENLDSQTNDLQSARRDITRIQNQIESVRNENTRIQEARTRERKEFEETSKRIGDLQREKQAVEEQNVNLQEQVEALNEALKCQQLVASAHTSRQTSDTLTQLPPSNVERPTHLESTRVFFTSPKNAYPLSEYNKLSRALVPGDPAETLKNNVRNLQSSDSPLGRGAQNPRASIIPSFATPQTAKAKETSSTDYHPLSHTSVRSSVLQPEFDSSASRSRRTADRKGSGLAHAQNMNESQSTARGTEAVQQVPRLSGASRGSGQTEGITPYSALPACSSPLSEIDSFSDPTSPGAKQPLHQDAKQRTAHKGNAKNKINADEAIDGVGKGQTKSSRYTTEDSERNEIPDSYPVEAAPAPTTRMRAKLDPLSATEESRRRRDPSSSRRPSALKNTSAARGSDAATAAHAQPAREDIVPPTSKQPLQGQPAPFKQGNPPKQWVGKSHRQLKNTGAGLSSNTKLGNRTSSNLLNSKIGDSLALQNQASQDQPTDQHSPVMGLPNRITSYGSKRAAATTLESDKPAKSARTSSRVAQRRSSKDLRSTIPDSQEHHY